MKLRYALVLAITVILGTALAQDNELTMLASAGGSGKTFAAAAADFTNATGIKVTVIQYPYAEVREKQLLELATGTGKLDVISIDGGIWLGELAQYLEPLNLSSSQVGRFVPSMLNMFKRDGQYMALPVRIGGWVLIYRKDLFDAAGLNPPKTWAEFESDAKKLTGNGVYGLAPAFKQGNYLVAQWAPILFSFGASILNDGHTAAAFNTPQGIKATQFMVDLLRKDHVVPPGAISYEHADVITAMQQGLTAMAFTYSPYFLNMNDPQSSKVAGKLAVSATIPYDASSGMTHGTTLISGWGFGVPKASKHKQEAEKFIDFVTSPEEQLKLAIDHTNAPTVTSVFKNPEYLKAFPAASQVADALTSAKERPGVKQWTTIEDILAKHLSAALSGDATVEQALAAAEKSVNQALTQ